ncbi:MAG: metallophosphoesterase [Hyphomonas sp.]
MKVIHVADIHIGATSDILLEAARKAISEQVGELVVVSGDLTQRGSQREFQKAREWVDALELPAIVVPGNHDTPLLHAGHRLTRPFARYTDYFGDLTRPLEVDHIGVFPLNTARGWQTRANWAEGSVRLSHLDEVIAAASAHPGMSILTCHHPFTSLPGAGLRTRTRRGEIASLRLAESAVRLLLTGHVHTPHAERIDHETGSYIAVSAGTLSHRLRKSPPGFNVLDITPENVWVTPFSYEDDSFKALQATAFRGAV